METKEIKLRRNRKGTPNSQLNQWESLPLNKMDGPFSLQQYIQQLIRKDPSDIEKIIELPEDQDKNLFIYEHLRQIIIDLHLFATFHNEVCTAEKQPIMKLTINGEQTCFLSGAFNPPREVSAIDYIAQTIEQTQDILNNSKLFPSRAYIPAESVGNFSTMFRRLYRIFAYSFFQHRELFDEFEKKYHLCERFTALSQKFQLMDPSLLWIPKDYFENL
ncbi:mob-like protein phocein [Anaeramoeba ignava]|uniref:Mob-like protein phocein n=1 Tax=Anaeramoeba ignava TaxID=1746090 RepID=A0A9Q0LS69_ANAIG|nr:mob-like protein phocein [Anaeramoeba ignava]